MFFARILTTALNQVLGFAPPHSKGPGLKTYTITLYALSDSLTLPDERRTITRAWLLDAMKGKVLASTALKVSYTRREEPHPPDRSTP